MTIVPERMEQGDAQIPLTLRLKRSVIRTPLESTALFLANEAIPLLRSALKPQEAALNFENKYQFEAVRRLTRPDSNCIDIGAHIGLMLRAMQRAAPAGRHQAVEALPWKAAHLRRKFPDAVIHECALGETAGTASFTEDLSQSGMSALSQFAHTPSGRTRTHTVEVKTLDAVALDGPPVALIKIDVEGAEGPVLLGGARLIARDRPAILFECGAATPEARTAPDAFDVLTGRFGYRVTTVRNFVFGGSRMHGRDAFDYVREYPATAFNFVALPE